MIRNPAKMDEITTIGVVGAGQMGAGIAQLAAVNGLNVWLLDSDPNSLTRATKTIANSLQRLASKGQLSQVLYLIQRFYFLHVLKLTNSILILLCFCPV